MIEAHIQLSLEEETCFPCMMMFPHVDATIPPLTEYYFIVHDDGRIETVCMQHLIATLQPDLSGESNE